MKRIPIIRLLAVLLLLLSVVLVTAACQQGDEPDTGSSAPDTIETVPPDTTEAVSDEYEDPETETT